MHFVEYISAAHSHTPRHILVPISSGRALTPHAYIPKNYHFKNILKEIDTQNEQSMCVRVSVCAWAQEIARHSASPREMGDER